MENRSSVFVREYKGNYTEYAQRVANRLNKKTNSQDYFIVDKGEIDNGGVAGILSLDFCAIKKKRRFWFPKAVGSASHETAYYTSNLSVDVDSSEMSQEELERLVLTN